MIRNALWTGAKYLLAIGVLFYVLYTNWEPADGRGLRHVVDQHSIDWSYLLLAFALHVVGLGTTLIRWYVLVRAQDLPFTLLRAIRIGTLGFLCNAFLPGSVGGDLIKAAAIAREQSRQTVAVSTVIMDRAMSLWGLILLLASVGSVCWYLGRLDGDALAPARVVITASVITIGLSSALWLGAGLCSVKRVERWTGRLSRFPKIGDSLAQFCQAIWLYRHRPASVVWALVLTTISNVCDVLTFFCYALTLGDGFDSLPTIAEHFLIVPVGLVISGVPLFPGGAGIAEAGFGGLYALFDSAPANGILGSLLFRVSGWIIGILGYLLCLAIDTKREK